MAPKKDEKKAAGPAKTLRTTTRFAEVEAKLKRIEELKVNFAGVGKALKPALVEMAGRTAQRLRHPTHHQDRRRKVQYGAPVIGLEKARDSSVGRRVAYCKTHQEWKAVSVQHETLQEMAKIENQYRASNLS